jgi:hypothetical protein
MSQQAHRRSNRLAETRPEASQPEATVAPPLKPKKPSKKDKEAALQENARIIAQTEDLSVDREYEERNKARQRAQGATKPGQQCAQGDMILNDYQCQTDYCSRAEKSCTQGKDFCLQSEDCTRGIRGGRGDSTGLYGNCTARRVP